MIHTGDWDWDVFRRIQKSLTFLMDQTGRWSIHLCPPPGNCLWSCRGDVTNHSSTTGRECNPVCYSYQKSSGHHIPGQIPLAFRATIRVFAI